MNITGHIAVITLLAAVPVYCGAATPRVEVVSATVPVVSGLVHSPAERIYIYPDGKKGSLTGITIDLSDSTDPSDITGIGVYTTSDDVSFPSTGCIGLGATYGQRKVHVPLDMPLDSDTVRLWVGVTLHDSVDLSHKVALRCLSVSTDKGPVKAGPYTHRSHRTGVLLHSKGDSGIVSCRIPGIATAADGTLLAIYDARYDSSRDLQGDIDIVARRSTDGGSTWGPIQKVLDMGCWGYLPERYNGVSDACILVDRNTGRIFVAGLWMHGALDSDGHWIEGLDETSDYWIHQWKGKGSQPGTGIKQTCQFLIAHSDDNGASWSFPRNITADTKRQEWWLYAPAPGQGITLDDGTLVFPSQGRDSEGLPFSNITYSTDGGKTWTASNPAYSNVTECNAVQLSSGSIMLNMRDNRNRGNISPNGRRISTTADLGTTWTEHPTSRSALIEPTCMASLHKHTYTAPDGRKKSVLLFANPAHHKIRKNLTLKASFDDGEIWADDDAIIIDETRGFGYSSMTSVDDDTIGILYESGIADMIFTTIDLKEILNR